MIARPGIQAPALLAAMVTRFEMVATCFLTCCGADINECLSNNGGCDKLTHCQNNPGSRTCGAMLTALCHTVLIAMCLQALARLATTETASAAAKVNRLTCTLLCAAFALPNRLRLVSRHLSRGRSPFCCAARQFSRGFFAQISTSVWPVPARLA